MGIYNWVKVGETISAFRWVVFYVSKWFFITEEDFVSIMSQIRGKKMAITGLCQTMQFHRNVRDKSLSRTWGHFPCASQTSQHCDCHQLVNWSLPSVVLIVPHQLMVLV